MKKSLISFTLALSLCPLAFAANHAIPYRQLNVGENYLKAGNVPAKYVHTIVLSSYIDNLSTYKINPASAVADYFNISADNLIVAKNLTQADFDNFAKDALANCADASYKKACKLNGSPHRLLINLELTSGTNNVYMPIILSDGIRTFTPKEVVDSGISGGTKNFYQMHFNTSDFSALPAEIVNLQKYFANTPSNVKYTFDATSLGGSPTSAIRKITGINQVSDVTSQNLFAINGSEVVAQSALPAGLYQITVKATEPTTSENPAGFDSASATFYVNVNAKNTSHFSTNKAPTLISVIGNDNSIFSYTSSISNPANPALEPAFKKEMQAYADDLKKINTTYLKSSNGQIKQILPELDSLNFEDISKNIPYNYYPVNQQGSWVPAKYKNDPYYWIDPKGITQNAYPNHANWIDDIKVFPNENINITYGFGDNQQQLEPLFSTFNEAQTNAWLAAMTQPAIENSFIDGLSIDFEHGYATSNADVMFKALADRLAYNGKVLFFYEFADKFNMPFLASLGPMGIAEISGYDVTTHRAPTTSTAPPKSNEIPIISQLTKPGSAPPPYAEKVAQSFHNGFAVDNTCDTPSSDGFDKNSWCFDSLYDSTSENNRLWASSIEDAYNTKYPSPQQAMQTLGENYQVTLPIAATSSQGSYFEIWNPNIAQITAGYMMSTSTLCHSIDNAWLKANNTSLSDKTSTAYQTLNKCLLSQQPLATNVAGKTIPIQTFGRCGAGTPYNECILISTLSDPMTPTVPLPTIAAHMQADLKPFTNDKNRAVGYGMFALEGYESASGCYNPTGQINKGCTEPQYVGWNDHLKTTYHDPMAKDNYASHPELQSNNVWASAATVLNEQ